MKHFSIVKLVGFAAIIALALAAGSCAATDVVGRVAGVSFKAMIDASTDRVSFSQEKSAWTLASTAGDTVAFSTDFASGTNDVEISFNAAPFLAAGLDPAKLVLSGGIAHTLEAGRLKFRFDLGSDAFGSNAKDSIQATFAEILKTRRDLIGYHAQGDHYGIALGGGNKFEWAKDIAVNKKDIIWELAPEPFIAAGVDPSKITGWVFTKVEIMEGTKKVLVDTLLRPFDLK